MDSYRIKNHNEKKVFPVGHWRRVSYNFNEQLECEMVTEQKRGEKQEFRVNTLIFGEKVSQWLK